MTKMKNSVAMTAEMTISAMTHPSKPPDVVTVGLLRVVVVVLSLFPLFPDVGDNACAPFLHEPVV